MKLMETTSRSGVQRRLSRDDHQLNPIYDHRNVCSKIRPESTIEDHVPHHEYHPHRIATKLTVHNPNVDDV